MAERHANSDKAPVNAVAAMWRECNCLVAEMPGDGPKCRSPPDFKS